MENDAFYEMWEGTITPYLITDLSKIYKSTKLLSNILDSCLNVKTQSLIINSFLNYCLIKNFEPKDIISGLYGKPTTIIKNLLLNKNYDLTKKDENLFLYGQSLFTQAEQLVQHEQNKLNDNYHCFMQKHNIVIEKYTFDTLFNSVIKMFPKTKIDTFEQVNSYIEKNKDIWNEQTNKFKNQKLIQKYNDKILKILSEWDSYMILDEPKNTEHLKHFIKISKMTVDGINKNKGLIKNFIPWFTKNADKNMWQEFTVNFELKNKEYKQKTALQLITTREKYDTNAQLLIPDYTIIFYKMVINNTPNERILWFNKHFLENALQNKKCVIEPDPVVTYHNITFKFIPENITDDNLKFTKWLHKEKVLSNKEYNNIIPIITAYDLDQKIPTSNNTIKTNKI